MTELDWFISEAALSPLIGEISTFGEKDLETGGFFLTPLDGAGDPVVALAGDVGIKRRSLQFQISEIALDRLFAFAESRGLWIPAQFHSHKRGAFLSPTDQAHGLCVEGFISAVIPTYANPPVNPAQWGWWLFTSRSWNRINSPTVKPGPSLIVRFDEDGVC